MVSVQQLCTATYSSIQHVPGKAPLRFCAHNTQTRMHLCYCYLWQALTVQDALEVPSEHRPGGRPLRRRKRSGRHGDYLLVRTCASLEHTLHRALFLCISSWFLPGVAKPETLSWNSRDRRCPVRLLCVLTCSFSYSVYCLSLPHSLNVGQYRPCCCDLGEFLLLVCTTSAGKRWNQGVKRDGVHINNTAVRNHLHTLICYLNSRQGQTASSAFSSPLLGRRWHARSSCTLTRCSQGGERRKFLGDPA